MCLFNFSDPSCIQGAMINGLEARVNSIEEKLSDLDARGSEETDNLANERNLDRFVMSGGLLIYLCMFFLLLFVVSFSFRWWFVEISFLI